MTEQVILGDINISSFLKAIAVFDTFRQHLGSEQEKAGAIQAFGFSFEQAWKT